MKNISKLCLGLSVVFACLVSACTEKEELVPVEVTFTAPVDLDMSALDSCESIIGSFELTSNADWSLNSDKMWVKLSLERDGWYFNDLRGGKGVHTVYIKVTNDARDFNEAQATVTLEADGNTQNVVTITRKGIEHSFELFSGDGEQIDIIEIGTEATTWVKPVANFECALLSCPEWVSEPEAFEDGYTLNVAQAFIPYEKEGTVTFGNKDGSKVFEVPVVYTGMDSTEIKIDSEYTPWNWKVSLDGKTFVQETLAASGENVETIVENALTFSVTCFNYDYKMVPLQVENGKLELMDANESWIFASQSEDDLSKLSVSVDSLLSGSRKGYLFALPVVLYDNFIDSLEVSSDVDTFVDSNINYVVTEIEQRDLTGSDGFIITEADGSTVPCAVEEEHYERLCSEFTITDLMACNLVPGKSYTINSRLTAEDWGGSIAIVELVSGNSYKSHFLSTWGSPKSVVGDDGTYSFTIKVPESLKEKEMVIMRLYNTGNINIKALVIRPVTQ